MTIEVQKYDLKDYSIFESNNDYDYYLWHPDDRYIILGRANNPEASLETDLVEVDNVMVYKRPSGGETVILTPNTLVISVKQKIGNELNTQKYFKEINDKIMDALSTLGVQDLSMKGISDISIGDKKILGSSIYLRKQTLFYHAVLNISESVDVISKYLKHPTKEPDYRKGRSHKEFVTSLSEQGYKLNVKEIIAALNMTLSLN
jgi:lipoate-protein ligase A